MSFIQGSLLLNALLRWGFGQAAATLLISSNAWMLSGLTSSPLVNSLLPAMVAVPMLLPVRRDVKAYGLQIGAAGLLVLVGVLQVAALVPIIVLILGALLGGFAFGFGNELSQLPLQIRLMKISGISAQNLRLGSEVGALLGIVLTGLLFPASRQFPVALILLLPLAPVVFFKSLSASASKEKPPAYDSVCAVQGFLFGALFGLLPLWVRVVEGAKCFDFAMILLAFALGRTLSGLVPFVWPALRYVLIALCLIVATSFPGWVGLLAFLLLGILAAGSDAYLVSRLPDEVNLPRRWQTLLRSSALGGLVGAFAVGLVTQVIGLTAGMPLLVVGFVLMAWFIGQHPFQSASA